MSFKSDDYLYGNNGVFIEELYNLYLKNPDAVDQSWRHFFQQLDENKEDIVNSLTAPVWFQRKNRIIGYESLKKTEDTKSFTKPVQEYQKLELQSAIANIIDAYRTYGHLYVQLDPLKLQTPDYNKALDYKSYGITEKNFDTLLNAFGEKQIKVRDLIALLVNVYSSRVGAEFSHLDNTEERSWISARLENDAGVISFSNDQKKQMLNSLMEADTFENYLHTKFPGAKRFSIEGGESTIISIEKVITKSIEFGIREIIIGMAHRGRLNILTKIMRKPYHAMLAEFKGGITFPDELDLPGDVKYHMGSSADVKVDEKNLHLSLTPNPSHLEVVNSVVLGRVRAKQDLSCDKKRNSILSLLIHGDAAYAGQGSVMESLGLSYLEPYNIGGTLHIVINNQIGFTANPKESRSSRYCTDVAKMINAPVFHVNGDDPEAVAYVTRIAMEYKNKFKKDVFVDIVCYRKYGHNEGDEPFFTQPIMYSKIKSHPSVAEIYKNKLLQEGIIKEEDYLKAHTIFKEHLDEEFKISETYKPNKADWLEGTWEGFTANLKSTDTSLKTGVRLDKLKELGKSLYTIPADFNAHSKIKRLFDTRKKMIESGSNLDWGTGETLAYATLLNEGIKIRMTGEDAERGTFSHRHAVIVDQKNENQYIALNHIKNQQNTFIEIHNSNLSEFGVLAFEYGYSYTSPKSLVIWEAQFGDFANGAQVIIDQYIASGEMKWLRMSGLVMLLPHGYEGQGPEHSSGRLERFLQLCARNNIVVANCTTPASLFHILRRQMHRSFRKPLVIMTPKSLLRHKLAVSNLKEMAVNTSFKPVIGEVENLTNNNNVKKVILCTGKVFYDLYEKRKELNIKDIVIIRLEQIYPVAKEAIKDQIELYPNAEVIWCQEEHKNMGAYTFIAPIIQDLLEKIGRGDQKLKYVGRAASATPAAGYMKLHMKELNSFLDEAFDIKINN